MPNSDAKEKFVENKKSVLDKLKLETEWIVGLNSVKGYEAFFGSIIVGLKEYGNAMFATEFSYSGGLAILKVINVQTGQDLELYLPAGLIRFAAKTPLKNSPFGFEILDGPVKKS